MSTTSVGTSMRHGTYSRYSHGCRCVPCKQAASAYSQQLRRRVVSALVPGHTGSYASYSNGCRCEPCREAKREYTVAIRAARVGMLAPDDPRHGTRHAYNHFRCRCDRCRKARSADSAEYYRRTRVTVFGSVA